MKRPSLFALILVAAAPIHAWCQGHGKNGGTCPAAPKSSPPVISIGCATPSVYTCLDSTFGTAAQLPPGGLVLTNMDGTIPGTSDLDTASAIRQQPQPDVSLRYVAIGTTTQQVGTTYVTGAALIRYNLNGSLDPAFGAGGIAKFYAPADNSLTLNDGVIDSAGNIVVVGNQNSGSTMILLRFTSSGVLDLTFNAVADNMPDLKPLSKPERLRSGWLNGIKHWQVDYTGQCPVAH